MKIENEEQEEKVYNSLSEYYKKYIFDAAAEAGSLQALSLMIGMDKSYLVSAMARGQVEWLRKAYNKIKNING